MKEITENLILFFNKILLKLTSKSPNPLPMNPIKTIRLFIKIHHCFLKYHL